jgi:hypothetical protein
MWNFIPGDNWMARELWYWQLTGYGRPFVMVWRKEG